MFRRVNRSDGVAEVFISERFIQSQEWETLCSNSDCPKEICKYRYIKDYVKYNGSICYQNITNCLKFSEIIHATHQNKLLSIIIDGGLKPGRKSIPGCLLDSFVWFGMKIGLPEVDKLRERYRDQCLKEHDLLGYFFNTDNLAKIDCHSIVNSPCFEPMSRYGEFKLAFEIQNVIKAYSQQFCLRNKSDFRILGTFVYKMEIMHTVLVCPPDTPETSKYLLLDQSNTPVIFEDPEKEGTFIWSPDSTGDKDKASEIPKEREPFRRWEHVTFAFYVPADNILKLDNVSSHISVCIYVNPSKGFVKSTIGNTIKEFLDKVSVVSTIETKRWMVNLLIRSVRGYLDEEKVFEKMNILDTYQSVDLDTVVDRVEDLLDGKEFDWSPLIEWMQEQTKSKTVLFSIFKYLQKKEDICVAKLAKMALQNT